MSQTIQKYYSAYFYTRYKSDFNNNVYKFGHVLDLGNQWALATFLHMGEAQPIKPAVRGVLGKGVGFSICAKIIGNGGRYFMMVMLICCINVVFSRAFHIAIH